MVDISDLIVAIVAAMPHDPSMIMLERLRNLGEPSTPERGGASCDIWRYDNYTGQRTLLPLGVDIRSEVRNSQFYNLIHFTLHASTAFRPRFTLPAAFNELPAAAPPLLRTSHSHFMLLLL